MAIDARKFDIILHKDHQWLEGSFDPLIINGSKIINYVLKVLNHPVSNL